MSENKIVLYHMTWGHHLKSILKDGLIPNHKPNKWPPGGQKRSKGKTFLCDESRMPYWEQEFGEGWAFLVGDEFDKLDDPFSMVWLAVDVNGLVIAADDDYDKTQDSWDDYDGDYWVPYTIPPERISVHKVIEGDHA